VIPLSDVSELAALNSWSAVRELCGSKAIRVAQAKEAGLAFLSGFVITSRAYSQFFDSGRNGLTSLLWQQILRARGHLEDAANLKLPSHKMIVRSRELSYWVPHALVHISPFIELNR
jgi:phosphoenolpyruvate synthase/pyruvate phosphate dikinase